MKQLLLSLALIGLAACSSTPKPEPIVSPELAAAEAARAASEAMKAIPESGLGPQELAPGDCGLFLWSKTDVTKFIFFSRASSGSALISRAAGPEVLSQTGANGDIFGQFNTQLSYLAPDGSQVALMVTPGEDLEGGQRVSGGLITTTDLEGWQTKLPVLGVRACQPE